MAGSRAGLQETKAERPGAERDICTGTEAERLGDERAERGIAGGLFVGPRGNGDARGGTRGARCARRAPDFLPLVQALFTIYFFLIFEPIFIEVIITRELSFHGTKCTSNQP
jgi:hypothetical protein